MPKTVALATLVPTASLLTFVDGLKGSKMHPKMMYVGNNRFEDRLVPVMLYTTVSLIFTAEGVHLVALDAPKTRVAHLHLSATDCTSYAYTHPSPILVVTTGVTYFYNLVTNHERGLVEGDTLTFRADLPFRSNHPHAFHIIRTQVAPRQILMGDPGILTTDDTLLTALETLGMMHGPVVFFPEVYAAGGLVSR